MRVSYPVEVLWNPNRAANGKHIGWSFPRAVERQLLADCQGKSVLHLFGGRSSFGLRLDVDPATRPDVIGDAWLPPFRKNAFDIVILDPPYFRLNSQIKNALFRGAGWIARETVIWFHTMWISSGQGLAVDRCWLVRVGDNCQVRALQYFRVIGKPGPVKHFQCGPAMKYNRWLAQPEGLPFTYLEEAT